MKILNGSRKPPTPHDIAALEKELRCSLDATFLEFLKENNGGAPRRTTYEDKSGAYFIQTMFPLSEEHDPNIRMETLKIRSRIHSHHACIGIVNGGDRLLIDGPSGRICLLLKGKIKPLVDNILLFVQGLKGEEAPEDNLAKRVGVSGDIEWLRRFVAEGNGIDSKSDAGSTIVQLAAMKGDLDFVKECVKLGANLSGVREKLEKIAEYRFLAKLEQEGIL